MVRGRWLERQLNLIVYLKAGLFTLVVPGTVAFLIPFLLAGGQGSGAFPGSYWPFAGWYREWR